MAVSIYSDALAGGANDDIVRISEHYPVGEIRRVEVVQRATWKHYAFWGRRLHLLTGFFTLIFILFYLGRLVPDALAMVSGSCASVVAVLNLTVSTIMLKNGNYSEYWLVAWDASGKSSVLLRTTNECYAHYLEGVMNSAVHRQHIKQV